MSSPGEAVGAVRRVAAVIDDLLHKVARLYAKEPLLFRFLLLQAAVLVAEKADLGLGRDQIEYHLGLLLAWLVTRGAVYSPATVEGLRDVGAEEGVLSPEDYKPVPLGVEELPLLPTSGTIEPGVYEVRSAITLMPPLPEDIEAAPPPRKAPARKAPARKKK